MSAHPTYPGRMVDTNSRAAAFLRHAGLVATDIPGEGTWVTLAEAEAEAARHGLTVAIPDPLPPPSQRLARGCVRKMLERGAHLMRLHPGSKRPVENAWQNAPALTEDEAVSWQLRGGGLGINLLRSGDNGWVVLDAENAAATGILMSMGFIPTAITANAQDPTSPKHGGTHVWMPLPAGVDPSSLRSTLQMSIGDDGGVIDVLVGTRYAVAPSTTLDSAPGYRYALAVGGGGLELDLWTPTPEWLIDPDAPAPDVPGAEQLHAILAPRRRRAHVPNPDADELTQLIDAVSWEEWLDGDPRVQILGVDGSCGCPVFHWAGASTQRSGILHEGCEYGYGAHFFSGTLVSQCGREHASRLDFAAWLRGRGDDVKSVAAEMGIDMGGKRATGFTAADIERIVSANTPSPSLQVLPGGGGGPAPQVTNAAPPSGLPTTDGAAALEAVPAPAPAPPAGGEFTDEDPEPEEAPEDTGVAMFRKIDEIDASGFWESLPILRRINRAATTNGVGRWGLLGATLPRIACTIPPHVRLVGASGQEGGQSSGASLNIFSILTGPPEEGKSETIKLSQGLVLIPPHAKPITNGTGEGVVKSFCYMKKADKRKGEATEVVEPEPVVPGGDAGDPPPVVNAGAPWADASAGYEVVRITDTVMLTAGEVSGMIAEMKRQGTKATSVYRSAWVGEEVGSATGEVDRRTYLAPHSYRLGAVLGAQVDHDALGPIFDEGKLGSPQRFLFLPATTVPAIGEPVTSIDIPTIDWYDGQGPAVAVGSLVAPHPPVWVHRPPAAHEEIEANRQSRHERRHLAYSVAEVRRRSEDEDEIDDIRGHELLHQLKLATVLAVGDGLREPTDPYWHAARVIMQVRELVVRTLLTVVVAQRDLADRKRGRSQGRSQAEARRAEAQAKQEYLVEVATRIVAILREKGAPASEAEIFRKLGKAQAAVGIEALSELVRGDLVYISDHNSKGKPLYWIR